MPHVLQANPAISVTVGVGMPTVQSISRGMATRMSQWTNHSSECFARVDRSRSGHEISRLKSYHLITLQSEKQIHSRAIGKVCSHLGLLPHQHSTVSFADFS